MGKSRHRGFRPDADQQRSSRQGIWRFSKSNPACLYEEIREDQVGQINAIAETATDRNRTAEKELWHPLPQGAPDFVDHEQCHAPSAGGHLAGGQMRTLPKIISRNKNEYCIASEDLSNARHQEKEVQMVQAGQRPDAGGSEAAPYNDEAVVDAGQERRLQNDLSRRDHVHQEDNQG